MAASNKDVDLSHHLSTLSKSRHASPLKDIIKYMYEPGMTSLAGGLPHPSLFPFVHADIEILDANLNLTPEKTAKNGQEVPATTHHVSLDRYGTPSQNTLSKAMQYTGGSGDAQLTQVCRDFVKKVYQPAREDFDVLLSSGNTDAWAKVVQLLCEPGEHILVEQFVYPSAQHFYIPMGCKGVPIEMDGDGILPEVLEEILKNWNTTHPGVKRPHVLYQVPVGQNPTGASQTWERKRRIYELATEYDLIVVEDDPYYFLQFEAYVQSSQGKTERHSNGQSDTSLIPSYLSLDTQGRVIRLETFSKTIAPGLRLGFFVASPTFTERLLRATEVSSQAPSGFSQAFVLEVLRKWGHDGYMKWLTGVKDAYCARRDWMCDALMRSFEFDSTMHPLEGYIARMNMKSGSTVPVLSFVPPKAGMFVWITLHLADNPYYKQLREKMDESSAVSQWSRDFWLLLIENKVLLTPGSYYDPWQGPDAQSSIPEATSYFRLAYSYESKENIEAGIEKLSRAIAMSWGA